MTLQHLLFDRKNVIFLKKNKNKTIVQYLLKKPQKQKSELGI